MPPTPLENVSRRRPISTIEVVALCIGVALLTVAAMAAIFGGKRDPVVAELERRYGSRVSRGIEEWVIRDYFQDRRDGTFLDVGASHYKDSNNTYFLETSLGWSGLAIDAIEEFGVDYKIHRPRTQFVGMFASDIRDRTVRFFVADTEALSSSDPEFIKRYGAQAKPREVPTTTLNAVLEAARIPTIDFLSMDIELGEPKALAGFDIARYRPAFACIEAHPEVRQQILDYFTAHAYVVVGKYLRSDSTNLYFRPLAAPTGSGASASGHGGTGGRSGTGGEEK